METHYSRPSLTKIVYLILSTGEGCGLSVPTGYHCGGSGHYAKRPKGAVIARSIVQ